jgi:hypothetical protein
MKKPFIHLFTTKTRRKTYNFVFFVLFVARKNVKRLLIDYLLERKGGRISQFVGLWLTPDPTYEANLTPARILPSGFIKVRVLAVFYRETALCATGQK